MSQANEKVVLATGSAKAVYSRIRTLLEGKRIGPKPSWLADLDIRALTRRTK